MIDQEAKWSAEFEEMDEAQLRSLIGLRAIYDGEPEKQQFADGWLREKAKFRKLREDRAYRYTQRIFWAAAAAVIVAIIGIFVTWLQ